MKIIFSFLLFAIITIVISSNCNTNKQKPSKWTKASDATRDTMTIDADVSVVALAVDTNGIIIWNHQDSYSNNDSLYRVTFEGDSIYTIEDHTGELATRVNGKWYIWNCKRALEVHFKIDSVRFNQPYIKEPEYKTEINPLNANNK